MNSRPIGTDGGGGGTGAVPPSLYRPQHDWVPQNNDERQPQQYQKMKQSALQWQQKQMGTGQLYAPVESQVQTPSGPAFVPSYHDEPPQYNPNPFQGEEQYAEPVSPPLNPPLNLDNKQDWRHQSHQAGEWKWPGGRGDMGQEVKQWDNPPMFVPPSGIVKTVTPAHPPLSPPPGSELKPGAAEFVPGGGGSKTSDLGSGGVNLGIYGGVQGGGAVETSTLSNVGHLHSIHPLDVRKAAVGPEMYETEYIDDGFDWSMGTSSLAVLPRRTMNSAMLPQNLWGELHRQVLDGLRQLPPDDPRLRELPPRFYAAFPLDDSSKRKGTAGAFGYPSATYKVASKADGHLYALCRLDKVRTTAKIVASVAEKWNSLQPHPSIVTLRGCFYQAGALFFINDYHPCAESLWERYIVCRTLNQAALLSEDTLWNFACQLLCGIRAVHAANLACWGLDPRHILYCPGSRLKLAWLGVKDVVEYESSGRLSIAECQAQDMRDLGRILLSIAFRMEIPDTKRGISDALAFSISHFSPFMYYFVGSLLKSSVSDDVMDQQHPPPTAEEAIKLASSHVANCLDLAFSATDALHSYLSLEYDNGRLLRLLIKLGMLNERPEHRSGSSWSDTGDRYVLKLFRDYLFHQVDGDMNPVLDMGHILHSLNKLDAGEEESIILTSRDQRNLLIVTFADVKRCLEESFTELSSIDKGPVAVQTQRMQSGSSAGVFGGGRMDFPAMG